MTRSLCPDEEDASPSQPHPACSLHTHTLTHSHTHARARATEPHTSSLAPASQQVFADFDTDGSGTLEAGEVRVLLRALKPKMRRSMRAGELNLDALVLRLTLEGKDGGVTLKQLSETVESLVSFGADEAVPLCGGVDGASASAATTAEIAVEMHPAAAQPRPDGLSIEDGEVTLVRSL